MSPDAGPGVVDATRASIVAYYGALPTDLAALVGRVRRRANDLLGPDFTPRPVAQVHATVIGLERPADPAGERRRFDARPLAAHLVRLFTERPLHVRFGGVGPADTRLTSRGALMYDRAFSTWDGAAVLIGWPVRAAGGGPSPCADLADVRQGCEAFGVVHRHRSAANPADPDVYLVVGRVERGAPVAALVAAVRSELAAAPVRVPMTADDLSLVEYTDTALPRSSTRSRALTAVAGLAR